jgi:hypothetical protein
MHDRASVHPEREVVQSFTRVHSVPLRSGRDAGDNLDEIAYRGRDEIMMLIVAGKVLIAL